MSSFEQASAIEPIAEQRFRAQIPDGWQQGRGAFGGLVLGVLARAMLAVETQPAYRLRALSGDICGPVMPGEATLSVEVLRRGKNLTNLDARLTQQGAVLARASAAIGAPRSVATQVRGLATPPTAESWEPLPVLPVEPPIGPVFATHYEYRSSGPLPLSGGPEPRIDAFVREKQRDASLDAPAVIALLDSVWPTLYSAETQPRALATVSFTAELCVDPTRISGSVPLRYRSFLNAIADGFATEFRELWAGDELVAMNQQTLSLIR